MFLTSKFLGLWNWSLSPIQILGKTEYFTAIMGPLPQAISNHTRGCLSFNISTSHFYCLLLLERGIQDYILCGMKSVFYPKSLKKTFQCPLLMFSWLVNRGRVKLWRREHSLKKDTCTLSHNTQRASTSILWVQAHKIKDWATGEGGVINCSSPGWGAWGTIQWHLVALRPLWSFWTVSQIHRVIWRLATEHK